MTNRDKRSFKRVIRKEMGYVTFHPTLGRKLKVRKNYMWSLKDFGEEYEAQGSITRSVEKDVYTSGSITLHNSVLHKGEITSDYVVMDITNVRGYGSPLSKNLHDKFINPTSHLK
jgi:hypothetical protein